MTKHVANLQYIGHYFEDIARMYCITKKARANAKTVAPECVGELKK